RDTPTALFRKNLRIAVGYILRAHGSRRSGEFVILFVRESIRSEPLTAERRVEELITVMSFRVEDARCIRRIIGPGQDHRRSSRQAEERRSVSDVVVAARTLVTNAALIVGVERIAPLPVIERIAL